MNYYFLLIFLLCSFKLNGQVTNQTNKTETSNISNITKAKILLLINPLLIGKAN